MKRFSALIFFFSVIFPDARAVNVNPVKAERAAVSFFQSAPATKTGSSEVRLVWDGGVNAASTKSGALSEPAPFYVFERDGGGFVVISGESGLRPVLGYSYEGSFRFENMPDHVSWWFNGYRTVVEELRAGTASPDPDAGSSWIALESKTKASDNKPVVKLETANWGQSAPYNSKCPEIGNETALTGCVATSCAIMMRYLKYPSAGYGTVPQYQSGSIVIPSHALGSYNWDKMPLAIYESSSEEYINEISQLMYDCGTALGSTYGDGNTSASSERIYPAMSDFFKFSKYASLLSRVDYKLDQWIEMLKNTLDSDYPILYQGSDVNGFYHAFVVDGYDSQDYFHFNWGWKGQDNGYFSLYDSEFYASNSAVFNLWKDDNWSSDNVGKLILTGNGLTSDTPYIESGKSFSLSAGLYNAGTAAYDGSVSAVHVSSRGTETLGSSNVSISEKANHTLSLDNLKINGSVSDGDIVRLVYSTSSGSIPIVENSFNSLPLAYKLSSAIGMEYDSFSGKITFTGLVGMKYEFNNVSKTATGRKVEFNKPSGSGTYPLVITNGHETVTIELTF